MTSERGKTIRGWSWLQRAWWFLHDTGLALSPARFSFFVALAGAAIFLLVQQGTEILRALAEPNPDTGQLDFDRVICFYAALVTWALYSWYWPRVLLNFHFPGVPAPHPGEGTDAIQWFRLHAPRILGVSPPTTPRAPSFFFSP